MDIETTCCICGQAFVGLGSSPAPVKRAGKCCSKCYLTKVLRRRGEIAEKLDRRHDEIFGVSQLRLRTPVKAIHR